MTVPCDPLGDHMARCTDPECQLCHAPKAETPKRVEDLFLADDLYEAGFLVLAEAVDDAKTHEDVLEIRASLQWLLDWADAG
jgi:hypothetical protein